MWRNLSALFVAFIIIKGGPQSDVIDSIQKRYARLLLYPVILSLFRNGRKGLRRRLRVDAAGSRSLYLYRNLIWHANIAAQGRGQQQWDGGRGKGSVNSERIVLCIRLSLLSTTSTSDCNVRRDERVKVICDKFPFLFPFFPNFDFPKSESHANVFSSCL